MAKYVDGFVLIIKKGKLDEYKKLAQASAKIWKKCGALEYIEAIGDDLKPNMGGMKTPTFITLAKPKPGEKVAFSFVVYKNRKHRDAVNKKVMADPFMNSDDYKDKPMPFDMKKMAYGGFQVIVEG